MSKQLNVEFDEMENGEGILDIAIRYDTTTGQFEFIIEEDGIPTEVPFHEFSGILAAIKYHQAVRNFSK